MEDNKKTSLNNILTEILGADFDAEKTKALESKINGLFGSTTVPKTVFNDKNNKIKELKQKLAEKAEKQKDAGVWQKQLDDQKAEYERQLKAKDDLFNDYRLTQALKDGKANNPKAVKALLDLTKLTFDADSITGLDEQLESLRQGNDSYLFDIPANTVKKGADFPSNPAQPVNTETKTVPKVI